tara:strand:+ start:1185 stop:2327 length:1143 start_codon:yes stop_codon:yes gene_type:complete
MGAMQMQLLSRGYLAYDLTGLASRVGYVAASGAITAVLFSLLGGVLADRMDKRLLIQIGQIIALILAIIVGLLISFEVITWIHLVIASFAQGMIMPLVMPARQALIPQLVGRKWVMNAIALNSVGISITNIAFPSLAGILIESIGIAYTYYLMAAMYLFAIVLTAFLPSFSPASRGNNVVAEFTAGINYVRKNALLLTLIILSFSSLIFAMPLRMVIPIVAKDMFSVDAEGLGWLLSAIGVGSLGGAMVVAFLGKLGNRGIILASTGSISGILLIAFSLVGNIYPVFWIGLLGMALMGLIQAARMTFTNSLMVEYSDEAFRGRVMSIQGMGWSLMPGAVLPITLISQYFSIEIAILFMGLALTTISLLVLFFNRSLKLLV